MTDKAFAEELLKVLEKYEDKKVPKKAAQPKEASSLSASKSAQLAMGSE